MENSKQLSFIIWLITEAIDKCQTIEEVRELTAEIRQTSAGLIGEIYKTEID